MKKIRLGNDIHVSWEILRNGEPEDFTDKVVEVKLVHAQTFTAVPIEWSIEGNVIEFDFFGKDQKRKGEYRIILTENRGELGMSTLDACEAFYLVDHSCKESEGTKCPTLKVQHVRLTGSFSLSGGGGSVVNPDISGQIEEHNQDKEAHPFIQNKIAKVVSEALADYVKKETGKGLSTNDFTDELKSKLDGYDPSELKSEIGKLETALNTLVSGNASNAIESFNEIVAFLNSVSDTETLEGIIAGIINTVSKIEEKIPTKVSELENDVPYVTDYTIPQGVSIMDASGNIMTAEEWSEDKGLTGLVVSDGTRNVVMAVTDVIPEGAADDMSINTLKKWSTALEGVDIEGLDNYSYFETDENYAHYDFNSKANTDAILSALSTSSNPSETDNAAVVARNYSSGIYGKGEWDLPACGILDFLYPYRNEMWDVLESIGKADNSNTFLNITNAWSSTEIEGELAAMYYFSRYVNGVGAVSKIRESVVIPVKEISATTLKEKVETLENKVATVEPYYITSLKDGDVMTKEAFNELHDAYYTQNRPVFIKKAEGWFTNAPCSIVRLYDGSSGSHYALNITFHYTWTFPLYNGAALETPPDYKVCSYQIYYRDGDDTAKVTLLTKFDFKSSGDGTKVLTDDGTYKELPAVVTSSTLVITQDSDPATIFNILSSGNYSKIKAEYVNGNNTYKGEAIEVVPNESNYSINFIGSRISSQNEKYNQFGFVFNIVVSASEIELITLYNGSKSSTIYPYHWDGSTINDTIWQELMNARLNSRLVIIGIAQPEVASISYMGSAYPSYQCLSTASNTYFINSYWSAETPYYEVIKINKLLKEISAFTSLNTSYYNKIEVTRDKTFDNYTHIEGYTNEYQGELIFGDTVYTVTFPEEVKWSTDSVLEYKPNHTYQFKIVNGLGVMKEFANS